MKKRRSIFFDDAALALRAIGMQRRIGRGGGAAAFELLECPVSEGVGGRSPRELERIVNRAVRAGGLLGLLNSCLTRSVIRCRLMRENGIDARVLFGLSRSGGALAGHCWVVWEGGPGPGVKDGNYQAVEIYPSPARFPGWTPE